MPLPRWVARANRVGLNNLIGRIATWMPGFGILAHRGRTSGQTFRTPLIVFRRGEGYLIALTYGPGTDWVKNTRAAGGCELITRRQTRELTNPRLLYDPRRTQLPVIPRAITGVVGVTEFLMLDLVPEQSRSTSTGGNHA